MPSSLLSSRACSAEVNRPRSFRERISSQRACTIFFVLICLFRIWLGALIGVWFVSEGGADDALLVEYAYQFNPLGVASLSSGDMAIKELGYPFFLFLVEISCLPYTFVYSALWIIVAYVVVRMFKYFTDNKIFLGFAFLFILFTPIAFEIDCGPRIYRNGIIPPFILLSFCFMLILSFRLIQRKKLGAKQIVPLLLGLGILLGFTTHIKEDGFWITACLLVFTIVWIALIIIGNYRHKKSDDTTFTEKNVFGGIALVCIPLLICVLSTSMLQFANYQLFQVAETNIRTQGEIAGFINRLYAIESDDRDEEVWVPNDVIDKAFEASSTLQSYPELYESIYTTSWFGGDLHEQQIVGDFTTWVLRSSLFDTGIWESEAQVTALFSKINQEIDAAFADGRLKKDAKFRPVSSTAGKSADEIREVLFYTGKIYRIHILLEDYIPGAKIQTLGYGPAIQEASILLNESLVAEPSGKALKLREAELKVAEIISSCIFAVYSVIQPLACIASILAIALALYLLIAQRRSIEASMRTNIIVLILTILCLAAVSFVFAFCIAWFCSFMGDHSVSLLVYGDGIVPILMLFELFGLCLLFSIIKEIIIRKKQADNNSSEALTDRRNEDYEHSSPLIKQERDNKGYEVDPSLQSVFKIENQTRSTYPSFVNNASLAVPS